MFLSIILLTSHIIHSGCAGCCTGCAPQVSPIHTPYLSGARRNDVVGVGMDRDPEKEGRNENSAEYQIACQLGEPVDWSVKDQRSKAPTKQYLQNFLLLALSSGLRELVVLKPENATEWLGRYLLEYDEEKALAKEVPFSR